MENTKIEWCDHTINLWQGCAKVHAGCDNCYAEALDKRWHKGNHWGNDAPRRLTKSAFSKLAAIQAKAAAANRIDTVFVGSLMDIFEKPMPLVDHNGKPVDSFQGGDGVVVGYIDTGDIRRAFFENIKSGAYRNIRFLLLTKRPSNIAKYAPQSFGEHPADLMWFGTSVSDQKTASRLIPQLVSAPVMGNFFVSIEPLLEYVNLMNCVNFEFLDWVIVGGESGAKKRPFSADWARAIMRPCVSMNLPFFMKQMDKVRPIPPDLMVRELPWG